MAHYKPYTKDRAHRRLQGEDVFRNKIRVTNPIPIRESPFKNYTGRKVINSDILYQFPPYPGPSFYYSPDSASPGIGNQSATREDPKGRENDCASGNSHDKSGIRAHQSNSSFTDLSNMGRHVAVERRSRTPQDGAYGLPFQNRKFKGASSYLTDVSDDTKCVLASEPVDLVISNLDSSIEVKDLRRMLHNMIKQFAMIQSLNVVVQVDGNSIANVRVNSLQEAQLTIAQLHRQKLGHKRIVISHAANNSPDPEQLRAMVIALLQEVPGNRMPLFKFLELVESRYHCNISVSEVNKLKDICKVTDELNGRMISLLPQVRNSPITHLHGMFCSVHCPNGIESRGWGESESIQLPNIKIALKPFSFKLQNLLTTHMGTLPLLSFPICYEAEIGECLPIDDAGVPLEHLISCVKNVIIKHGGPNNSIKYIKREIKTLESDKEDESFLKTVPSSLLANINLLCRELVDLLKTTDRCQLLLNRFIPAYHHHFGRQCRVADYGYTKLLDLFESIPHVVQIIADGNKRTITLSHSAQVRRFTSDLLRVLKCQMSKQLNLIEFPSAYEKILAKPFNPVEYGLCYLEDLLEELPENTIVITKCNDVITVAIPKREQTSGEVLRTRQFAIEVVELLRHSPQCAMLFNKFVPAYHHHFGHQCKVSDYGFTKLIELFESIPDTVKIEDLPDGERKVSLTLPQAVKVVGSQIVNLIKKSQLGCLQLNHLNAAYIREYGYSLKPEAFSSADIKSLIMKLGEYVQIVQGSSGLLLLLADGQQLSTEIKLWTLLLKPPHQVNVTSFLNEFKIRYHVPMSFSNLGEFSDVVVISTDKTLISLTPFYILAAQLYHLLYAAGGQILFSNLEAAYMKMYNSIIHPSEYNAQSYEELLKKMDFFVIIRGTKKKMNVILNAKLTEYGIPIPASLNNNYCGMSKTTEFLQWPLPPHDLGHNNIRGITPPKPDTPPAHISEDMMGSFLWNSSVWSTPLKSNSNLNLSIPLPTAQTPKLLMNIDKLISPTKNLLPAHSHPLSSVIPMITAPDPAHLPMPDKLMKDEASDSGVVNNSKLETTDLEIFHDKNLGSSVSLGNDFKFPTCSN